MGRRHHGERRGAVVNAAVVDAQAFGVHRDRREVHGQRPQGLLGEAIARIFQPNAVTGSEHQPGHQVQGRLVAGRHDHLVRAAMHAARHAEVSGDRFAKQGQAGRIAGAEAGLADASCLPCGQSCPDLAWEQIQRGKSQLERQRRDDPIAGVGGGHARRRRLRQAVRTKRRRHERAVLSLGDEIALLHQARIGQVHRATRNVELGGEAPRRRQACVGAHTPSGDRATDALIKLLLKRGPRSLGNPDLQISPASWPKALDRKWRFRLSPDGA